MRTTLRPLLMAAISILSAATAALGAPLSDPELQGCLVQVKSAIDVPAQDAGVLVSLDVSEGDQVLADHSLGKIDDMEPQMQKRLAEYERQAAEEQARNDINVRYARAQADVSEATFRAKIAANKKAPNTVTLEELRRVKLDWDRTVLSIEQAVFDQTLTAITVQAKSADVETAEKGIERRHIKAPIDGVVVAVLKHDGEWVSPGDTILHIINLDVLRIDGFLNASEYDPRDVEGRPVTVKVQLAHGRGVEFSGKVIYVSPQVQTGGDYPVWAEVTNRQEDGKWLMRPGLTATMTIHVQ